MNQRRARAAIHRAVAPTLLLWGDQDPLVDRHMIDHLVALRPDWDLHVFETVGHVPPMEVPGAYVEAVGRWLTTTGRSGR